MCLRAQYQNVFVPAPRNLSFLTQAFFSSCEMSLTEKDLYSTEASTQITRDGGIKKTQIRYSESSWPRA